MSTSKHHAVQFTVRQSDQNAFFSCLAFILPDLTYMVYEVNDLTLELKVLFCFKSHLSEDLCKRGFNLFYDLCKDYDVCLSNID